LLVAKEKSDTHLMMEIELQTSPSERASVFSVFDRFEFDLLPNPANNAEEVESQESLLQSESTSTSEKQNDFSEQYLGLTNIQNIAIPISYFNVGIAMTLLSAPISYYLIKEQNASSAQYASYVALNLLPWAVKFLFGLLIDLNPIFGYRRKSWLVVGWSSYIVINFILAMSQSPTISTTIMCSFLLSMSYLLADVCVDALVVERSRFESRNMAGSVQANCYTCRYFGSVIGAIIGSFSYGSNYW
jgi:hypothetical protein